MDAHIRGVSRNCWWKRMGKHGSERLVMAAITEMSSGLIRSAEYLNNARKRPQDFTRKRKMPFDELIAFMLNMVKSSIQTCLDAFFERIGRTETHMTQQSFSEARDKIKWEAFRYLFSYIRDAIYTGYYETWHGYRVSAIDGSKLQLPDDVALRDYFGTVGKGSSAATGQGSVLYDVYNNFILDAHLEPIKTGERELALRHIDVLRTMPSFDKECVICDRGYASFELIQALRGNGIRFVMRVRRKFNLSIDRLGEGDHDIILQKKGHEDLPVRVIKFTLPSGETEALITDITDKRMGIGAFKALYFKRWPIETKYDEIKNKLAVENFSGRTINAVMQDFFITMYMSNVIATACWEAQSRVDEARALKDNKYDYHVNVNHVIGAFKDRFILAVLEPSGRLRAKNVRRIIYLLTEHVVPSRPGRSAPRNPSPRKAKFRQLNC